MQENYKVANATQETKFRVGQTVWCLLCGKGKVVEVVDDETYPVRVAFSVAEECSVGYTLDGKYYSGANRTLFFSEPQVIAATEPVFEPKLVGKVVAVWCNTLEVYVQTGQIAEESEDYLTLYEGSKYSKNNKNYAFHEVTPQPITFD